MEKEKHYSLLELAPGDQVCHFIPACPFIVHDIYLTVVHTFHGQMRARALAMKLVRKLGLAASPLQTGS